MKLFYEYMKRYKRESVLAPLFKMLEATFELIVPLVVAAIIDVGIRQGDRPYVLRMCGVLILFGVVGLAFSITAQYFAARAGTGVAAQLRHELFEKIQSLSFSQADRMGTDTLITRMTSDVNQVQSAVNLLLRLFLRSPFIVLGAMIMAFTVDVPAALVFVGIIPLLSLVVFGIMLITMPMYRRVQGRLDRLMTITGENLAGVRVIRAFNREAQEERAFRETNEVLARQQRAVGRISGLMNPLTYVMINLATVVLLYTGAVRVDLGILTQGQVIALLNYMSQILVELVKLANLIVQMTRAAACASRLSELLRMQPDMADGPEPVRASEEPSSAEKESFGAVETPEASRNMEEDHRTPRPIVAFRDVSLRYGEEAGDSLEHISFEVRPGQTVGIIGGTGSGKSSLVNLIPRFYDATEGRVEVFGRDVKAYAAADLRRWIGVVPQKAELFRGSIADNLRWGNPEASKEALEEALAISQAKEYVDQKEGGMEYRLTQHGRNLSGGQRQRLTIARALVRCPKILILDDSASALDFATDARLREAIRGMRKEVTTFIVSQRAASVRYADLILVLDEGRLSAMGRHEDLLEGSEVYREIYYSQFPKEESHA